MDDYKKIIIIYDPIKDIAAINGFIGNREEILEVVKNKLTTLRNEALSNTKHI